MSDEDQIREIARILCDVCDQIAGSLGKANNDEQQMLTVNGLWLASVYAKLTYLAYSKLPALTDYAKPLVERIAKERGEVARIWSSQVSDAEARADSLQRERDDEITACRVYAEQRDSLAETLGRVRVTLTNVLHERDADGIYSSVHPRIVEMAKDALAALGPVAGEGK